MTICATACWTPIVGETTHRLHPRVLIRRMTSASPSAVPCGFHTFITEKIRPSSFLLMKAFGYTPEAHHYLFCHHKAFGSATFPLVSLPRSFTIPRPPMHFLE